MKGIYYYFDLKKEEIVYIGKDSHIERKNRHSNHICPSQYNKQPINRVIQNNPTRYEYMELIRYDFKDYELNNLERSLISSFKPLFNFAKGGDDNYVYSELRNKRISESKMGHDVSVETRKKISEKLKGRRLSEIHKNKISNGLLYYDGDVYLTTDGKKNGKVVYSLRHNKKRVKTSVDLFKVLLWFHNEYPNQKLNYNDNLINV